MLMVMALPKTTMSELLMTYSCNYNHRIISPRTNLRFYLSINSVTNYLYDVKQYMVDQSNPIKKKKAHLVNRSPIQRLPILQIFTFLTLIQQKVLLPC